MIFFCRRIPEKETSRWFETFKLSSMISDERRKEEQNIVLALYSFYFDFFVLDSTCACTNAIAWVPSPFYGTDFFNTVIHLPLFHILPSLIFLTSYIACAKLCFLNRQTEEEEKNAQHSVIFFHFWETFPSKFSLHNHNRLHLFIQINFLSQSCDTVTIRSTRKSSWDCFHTTNIYEAF